MPEEPELYENVHTFKPTLRVDMDQFIKDKFWLVANQNSIKPVYESLVHFMDAFQDEAERILGKNVIDIAVDRAVPTDRITLTCYVTIEPEDWHRQVDGLTTLVHGSAADIRSYGDDDIPVGEAWSALYWYETFDKDEELYLNQFQGDEDAIISAWFFRNIKAEQPYGTVFIDIELFSDASAITNKENVLTCELGSRMDNGDYRVSITAPWIDGCMNSVWCRRAVRSLKQSFTRDPSDFTFYAELKLRQEPDDAKHTII